MNGGGKDKEAGEVLQGLVKQGKEAGLYSTGKGK